MCNSSPAPAPSAPTSQTITQSNIPDWAQPYAQQMLGQTQALTNSPYQQYQGQRIADFNPLQQQAFSNVANMQTNAGTGAAMGYSQDVAQRAAAQGPYNAQNFGNQYGSGPQFQNMGLGYLAANAPNLNQYQMGQAQQVSGNNVNNQNINSAQSGYQANLNQYGMGPADQVSGNNVSNQNINAAQSGYQANLNQYGMGPAQQVQNQALNQYQMGPASQVRSQNFGQRSAEDYMSQIGRAHV